MDQEIFALIAQLNLPEVGRANFAIFVPQISMREPLLLIECEDRSSHERTTEQVRHDDRRDRALQRLGIPILRFTATEIARNSESVAHEIVAFVRNKLPLIGRYARSAKGAVKFPRGRRKRG
jgi:hypothetical protein